MFLESIDNQILLIIKLDNFIDNIKIITKLLLIYINLKFLRK